MSRKIYLDLNGSRKPLTEQEARRIGSQKYEVDDPHWMLKGPEVIPGRQHYFAVNEHSGKKRAK